MACFRAFYSLCLKRVTKIQNPGSASRRILPLLAILGLTVFASPWASAVVADQCSGALSNGSLGHATGCGAVITVTGVDGNGNATAFVVDVTGNGNPYDGTEDTLVGVQNNSGAVLSSMTLTSANTTFGGLFGLDGDGPCNYTFGAFDCLNGAYPEADPFDYAGPNNTFSNINSVSCQNFGTCHTSGTVTFTVGIPNGGSTWFALEGTPQSLSVNQTGSPMNPNNPANLNQPFVFNNATGQHVEFDFDYTTSFTAGDLNVVDNTIPTVADQGITQTTYLAMVAGTSLATTSCFIAPGQGTDASGNPLCVQSTLTCTNANSNNPAGDNCPQSTTRNLYWAHQLDTPGTGMTVPAGTAPSIAMGSDTWSPANCTLVGQEAGFLCPQSMLTQFALLATDNSPKPGGTGKTSNSSYVSGCCEPEWSTVPTVPLWSNNTTVPLSFKASPPSPASPTNNWVAAPNQSITWGEENLGATPDTTFPVTGDQTVTNSTACPSAWPPPGTVPPPFTAAGTVTVPGQGAYEVHFFSTACDNQEELMFPGTISNASPNNVATFKTAPFNVDTTAPNAPTIALSPSGGYYAQNSSPTATVSCTDPSSVSPPNFFSGIGKCGAQGSPQLFGGQQMATTTPILLSTSTLGTQTFTAIATDVAGNSTTASVSYQVVGSANLAIAMIGNLVVKTGKNMTYYIAVINSGPNTADLVTITDAIPAGTTFVSSGYALESCNFSGGRPICSITPPTNSCGGVAGNCNVGALTAWTNKNPIGALVQITVTVNAQPNTTITDTSIVGEANSDPNPKNSATWKTLVVK